MEATLGLTLMRLALFSFIINYVMNLIFTIEFVKDFVKTDSVYFNGTNLKRPFVMVFSVFLCWIMNYGFVIPALGLAPQFPEAGAWIDYILTGVILSGGTSFVRDFLKEAKESRRIIAEAKANGTS